MEYLEPEQEFDLVARLVGLTKEEKVRWERRAESDFSLSSSVGDTAFVLTCADEDDEPPFILTVWRDDLLIDDIRSKPNPEWIGFDESDLNGLLSTLYRLAKRQALSMDVVVKAVFDDLSLAEGDVPF